MAPVVWAHKTGTLVSIATAEKLSLLLAVFLF